MKIQLLITLFAVALVLFVYIYISARKRLRQKGHVLGSNPYIAAVHTLESHFSGHVSKCHRQFMDSLTFIGVFSGHKFHVALYPAPWPMLVPPTKLMIRCFIPTPSKLKIFFYQENPRAVFLAKKVEMPDKEFRPFFIYSNKPEEASRYLADATRNAIIKNLLQEGWGPPSIIRNRITITTDIKEPNLKPDFIKETLNKLMSLRSS